MQTGEKHKKVFCCAEAHWFFTSRDAHRTRDFDYVQKTFWHGKNQVLGHNILSYSDMIKASYKSRLRLISTNRTYSEY